MEQFLKIYLQYRPHLEEALFFGRILIHLLIGIMAMNTFNKTNEKDLTGKQLLVAMIFLSSVIYYGMIEWANRNFILFTSSFFGFGARSLLTKWRKNKVWDLFDFISNKRDKGGGKE